MTRKSKRPRQDIASRPERDRKAIKASRFNSLSGVIPEEAAVQTEETHRVIEHTINWGNGNVFVPQLLTESELPDITSRPLRALINNTAKGEPTPKDLRAQLSEEPVAQIGEAIIKGIHRWHTYGKERK